MAPLRRATRSGAVLPPPIRVQCGAPPKSSTCPRTRRIGSPSTAPMAQPRESSTRIFSCRRASSERSSYEARTTKAASCSASVMNTPCVVNAHKLRNRNWVAHPPTPCCFPRRRPRLKSSGCRMHHLGGAFRLPPLNGDVMYVPRPHILGSRPDKPVIGVLLQDMGGPSCHAAAGEERGHEVSRDAESVVDHGRDEVEVCIQPLLSHHDLLELLGDLEEPGLAGLLGQLLGVRPKLGCPGVRSLVDPVAEARHLLALG